MSNVEIFLRSRKIMCRLCRCLTYTLSCEGLHLLLYITRMMIMIIMMIMIMIMIMVMIVCNYRSSYLQATVADLTVVSRVKAGHPDLEVRGVAT